MHFVIVGNSVAGIEAAIAIRKRDARAEITVVSYEHDHPFARVSLMYLFAGQLRLKDTEFYDRDLYTRLRLRRVRDLVVGLDSGARRLHTRSGEVLSYDRLLLAVGSRARPLPHPGLDGGVAAGVPGEGGVHQFVTLADYEALDRAARPGMSVAVIGGGLIGVEAAEVLRLRGLRTHFLIREPWYFPVALDDREAGVVAAHIRGHGVDCRTGYPVERLERQGGGWQINGELTVDLVVAAIGVVPNTGFLAGSGVALDPKSGGVETKDDLSSISAEGVYAAGDCAMVTWPDGSRRPEQLWYTARDQGRAAGRAMLGDAITYRRSTFYNSAKFFDVEYTTAGWIPPSEPKLGPGWSTWYQHEPGSAVTLRVVCKDGVVRGMNALGSRWDHQVWLRWIAERRPLAWALEHMEEARFDEEFMPPFRVRPDATLTEGA
jgi:NADPH-dependent 2,4-dienoyl-CoA reductase/sulfur reductase-like enzyme